MGLFGSDPDPRIRRIIEGADGDSISESTLTRVGTRTFRWGTFEDRPLVDYLREDEQPHYVLATVAEDFEFDEEEHYPSPGYWHTLVVTDQRMLVLAGAEDGDRGEVVPHEVVDPDSLAAADSWSEKELTVVAGGVECEFEGVGTRGRMEEIERAARYVRHRALGEAYSLPGDLPDGPRDDLAERERPRDAVYEIPNLDVGATIPRPDDGDPTAAGDEGSVAAGEEGSTEAAGDGESSGASG